MNLMRRPDVDCIVNACDAGREGELIFRLVYDHAKCAKPMMRFWVSSMEESAIRAGFDNLKDGAQYNDLSDDDCKLDTEDEKSADEVPADGVSGVDD